MTCLHDAAKCKVDERGRREGRAFAGVITWKDAPRWRRLSLSRI